MLLLKLKSHYSGGVVTFLKGLLSGLWPPFSIIPFWSGHEELLLSVMARVIVALDY